MFSLRLFKHLILMNCIWKFCDVDYCSKGVLVILQAIQSLKVYQSNTSQSAFTCSKLTIEILELRVKYVQSQRQWCRSGSFIVNFEHILHIVLVLLLFTWNV